MEDIRFSNDTISTESERHIYLGFESGEQFIDESGALCPVHDAVDRKWQHLNFFEHSCLLHCAVPRIKTTDGKVRKWKSLELVLVVGLPYYLKQWHSQG